MPHDTMMSIHSISVYIHLLVCWIDCLSIYLFSQSFIFVQVSHMQDADTANGDTADERKQRAGSHGPEKGRRAAKGAEGEYLSDVIHGPPCQRVEEHEVIKIGYLRLREQGCGSMDSQGEGSGQEEKLQSGYIHIRTDA